jgi:hypothetical protein
MYGVLYTVLCMYGVLYTALCMYGVLYTVLCMYGVLYTALCINCVFSLVRMKVRDSDVLARVRGQRKMSQVLGTFGLPNYTALWPVLAWRAI